MVNGKPSNSAGVKTSQGCGKNENKRNTPRKTGNGHTDERSQRPLTVARSRACGTKHKDRSPEKTKQPKPKQCNKQLRIISPVKSPRSRNSSSKEAVKSCGKETSRANHMDLNKLKSPERSKQGRPQQHNDQLKMKMCNEASPSKSSKVDVHTSVVRTSTHSRSDSDDNDDISIHTDDDTDSDSAVGIVKRSSKTHSDEVFSSTSDVQVKSLPSRKKGLGCGRNSKQLKRKAVLSKSKAASNRLRQLKEQDTDSEWESASEMEMSEIKEKLQDFDADQLLGQESMTSDGRLLIDVDENEEEIEEHQIPMKQQLEKTIADGCAKNNLSVANVKKILRSLVTHDLVKEMLRTTLQGSSSDTAPVVYEPKLTRSKMKEVLEKGKDPHLWPVSPVKLGHPAPAGPSILDVEFTDEEDEEDDEYEPSRDVEDVDSDEESITSSRLSDFGSPVPLSSPAGRTPTTPTIFSMSASTTPVHKDVPTPSPAAAAVSAAGPGNAMSPMGPPLAPPPSMHSTRQRLTFTPEKNAQETEEDGIARRTRSKLPLTNTTLYDIEEAFVAPDITPDMYDTMCDDTDWQDFLKSLHMLGATDAHNESMEVGEEDDPEFNYIAEAETEEIPDEEVRFEGPFRITRKEVNSLMEELEDLFNEEDYSMIGLRTNLASAHENAALLHKKSGAASDSDDEQQSPRKLRSGGKEVSASSSSSSSTALSDFSPMVLEQQRRQIEQQMRQHIQLTTQMFVLSQGSDDYQPMADLCKRMVKELDWMRSISRAGSQSAYNVCNLAGAMEIVDRDIPWALHRQQQGLKTGAHSSGVQASASASVSSQSNNSEQAAQSSTSSVISTPTTSLSAQSGNSLQTQFPSSQSGSLVTTKPPPGQSETTANSQPSCSQSADSGQPSSAQTQSLSDNSVASVSEVTRQSQDSSSNSGQTAVSSSECSSKVSVDTERSSMGTCNSVTASVVENNRQVDQNCAAGSGAGMSTESKTCSSGKSSNDLRRSQPCLLEIQKEVLWSSPVFLYPTLLPRAGLLSMESVRRLASRAFFSDWEDRLLIMGKEQFKDMPEVYKTIHQYMMPCKTPQQLRDRFKRAKRKKKDSVWNYRETGLLPKTPREVEEFSSDMVKAPCDQPLSSLPAWCKIHLNNKEKRKKSSQRRERAERMKKLNEERKKRVSEKRLMRYRKEDKARTSSLQKTTREQRQYSSRKQMEIENEDSTSESELEEESDYDSDSGESSDSSYRPPVKRFKTAAGKEVARQHLPHDGLLTTSNKSVSILSSVGSSLDTDKPSAIVTSAGVYVPIQLADLAKMQAAMAAGHFTAMTESGEQRLITSKQLFGSKLVTDAGDMPSVSAVPGSEQRTECVEPDAEETAIVQVCGTGCTDQGICESRPLSSVIEQTIEAMEVGGRSVEQETETAHNSLHNSETSQCAVHTVVDTDCHRKESKAPFQKQQSSSSGNSQESGQGEQQNLLQCRSATQSSVRGQLMTDGERDFQEGHREQQKSDSDTEQHENDQNEVRTDSVVDEQGHMNTEELEPSVHDTGQEHNHVQRMDTDDEQTILYGQSEAVLTSRTSPENDCGSPGTRPRENLPNENSRMQGGDNLSVQVDQCSSTVPCSDAAPTDEQARNKKDNSNEETATRSDIPREQNSTEERTPSPQQQSPGCVDSCGQSNQTQLVYQFHIRTDSSKLLQKTPSVSVMKEQHPTASLSPRDNTNVQLDVLQAAMKKILGSPVKGPRQEVTALQNGESSGCSKPNAPMISLPGLPNIVNTAPGVKITVNMMYSSDYNQPKSSSAQDSAENPSSTTPDGEEGEASSQGEVRNQGETSGRGATSGPSDSRSPLSEDAVSTTSDIGEHSEPAQAPCDQVSESGETSRPGAAPCEEPSVREEQHANYHVPWDPASESGQSASREGILSSPRSESRESRSRLSVPALEAGESSTQGNLLSGLSCEGMSTVSSSSPLRIRPGVQCENLHSDETIQFHLAGFESFFEVTSTGDQPGSSGPLSSKGLSSEAQNTRIQTEENVTAEEHEIQHLNQQAEERELVSHSSQPLTFLLAEGIDSQACNAEISSGRDQPGPSQLHLPVVSQIHNTGSPSDRNSSLEPNVFGGVDSQIHENKSSPQSRQSPPEGTAQSPCENGSPESASPSAVAGSDAAAAVSRASTVPHTSWSGPPSVCSSSNFNIVISVTVPSGEEFTDTSLDTGVGVDSSSVHNLNVASSASETNPSPSPSFGTANPVTGFEILEQEPTGSEENWASDAGACQVVPDGGAPLPVGSPVSSSCDLPSPAREEEDVPSLGNLPTEQAEVSSVGNLSEKADGASLGNLPAEQAHVSSQANVSEDHPDQAVDESVPAEIDSSLQDKMLGSQDEVPQENHRGDSQQGDTEPQNLLASAESRGEAEVDRSENIDEMVRRQTLLKLIQSARHTDTDSQADGQGQYALNICTSDEVSGAAVHQVVCHSHEEREKGEVVIQRRESDVGDLPGSPVKVMSVIQAENERSPSRRSARDEDTAQILSCDSPEPSQASSAIPTSSHAVSHPQQTFSPENPGTPSVLSSLGLVTATGEEDSAVPSSSAHALGPSSSSQTASSTVIATLMPHLSSSPSETPATYTLQCAQDTTPIQSPAASLRVLAPKPGSVVYPSPPRVPRSKCRSPKRQQLQKKVRSILPKGYTYEMKMSSPTKVAARTLKRKATLFCQRSPNKPILPREPNSAQSAQSQQNPQGQASTSLASSPTATLSRWTRRGTSRRGRSLKKKDAATPPPEKKTAEQQKGSGEGSQEESDETGSEMEDVAMLSQEDSQNEEEAAEIEDDGGYMNDLMAASTTIGFNPYKKMTSDKDGLRSRKEIRREQKLSLLATDVEETDPRKDDRDTACAQVYLNKVKLAMQKDLNTYTQFMDLLRQFETSQVSPVEMYETLSGLLANYPELREDFAGFMLPVQALQTGCHVPNQLFHDVRAFLRKLELHFDKSEPKYQKVLRTLGRWDLKTKSPEQLREMVVPLLRSMPQHLHDDFVRFFPDLRPSENHMEPEDFEDVRLGNSDEEANNSPDDFEDIKFADENDPYRTKRCPCPCHQEMIGKRNREGIRHCYSCCLKVVDGQLYFQPSNVTTRRPVSATFHDPIPMPLPSDPPPPSAHSRGNFNFCRSAVVNQGDEDEVEEEMEEDEEAVSLDDEEEKIKEEKPQAEVVQAEDVEMEEAHQMNKEEEDVEAIMLGQMGLPSLAQKSRTVGAEELLPLTASQPTASRKEALQSPASQSGSPSQEETLPSLTRRPSSPMQSLPPLSPSPAGHGIQHNRLVMPSPGGNNSRMRKRIMNMRPGRHVSASMHSVTGSPRHDSELSSDSSCQGSAPAPLAQGAPGTSNPPLLAAPSGAQWAAPMIDRERGTLSVVGPDNTVIMYNSSLPAPALGETLPVLHDKRTFYSLPKEQRAVGSDRVSPGSSEQNEEKVTLPTITSPNKNIQRGSFAGLLQKYQPASSASDSARLSVSCMLPSQSTMGDSAAEKLSDSPPALMSEDTINALLAQMQGDTQSGDASQSLSRQSDDNTSPDLLSKAMQFARIRPGETDMSSLPPDTPTKTQTIVVSLDPGHGPKATPAASTSHGPQITPAWSDRGMEYVENREWSREEDKLILEMVRDYGDSQNTYVQVAARLQQTTTQQVMERLSTLVELLGSSEEDTDDEGYARV